MTAEERLDQLIADQRAILARIAAEGRDLTGEEMEELDSMRVATERAEQAIQAQERLAALEASAGRRAGPAAVGATGAGDARMWGSRAWRPGQGSLYARTFGQPAGDLNGFRDGREWFQAALSGRFDPRLIQAAGSSTQLGSEGGLFMPVVMQAGLLDDIERASSLFGLVRTIAVPAKSGLLPVWEQYDRSQALLGGFAAEWVGEGQDGTLQTGKATEISYVTNKLAIYTKATSELLDDSALFVSEFQPALMRAAAYSLDRAIVRGNGAARPLGLMNDPAALTVAKESGQAADTFLFKNAVNMYGALYVGGVSRSVWLVHPTVVPALLLMKDVVTNVAGTENVGGVPAVTMDASGNLRLLGRPVVQCEHCAVLGDLGDVMLVDPTQYAFFLRNVMSVETDRSVYFMSDQVAFRLLMRGTGQGLWPKAAKRPGDSSATESWLVLLQAR